MEVRPVAKRKTKPDPAALAAAQFAVRDGDTSALEAWAKEVEAAGDPAAAKVIRDFPGLRDNIGGHLTEQRKTWPDVQVYLHHQYEKSYWFLGDWDMAESSAMYPDHWPHMMGLLVQHWNLYYPGVEWLARVLGFQLVNLDGYRPSTNRSLVPKFALHEGEHLTPIEPGDELSTITLAPYVSPKVAGPGECPRCAGQHNVVCEACDGNAFVVVDDEERECERCDCLGFHTCPACKGSGKLPKAAKATAKPKPKTKGKAAAEPKAAVKSKPAAKGEAEPPAKKKPKK